ncbi:hypothetical protein DX908_03710 [Parvularcula marina]|uniref:Uncharacterized protein n=1 Tax=Parvularcula marina TaxID=2292771 RepID=A0A371RG74_9PROT|nr:hypothetical protein DX908_03710 [Parvularcula marina]
MLLSILKRLGVKRPKPLLYVLVAALITGIAGAIFSYHLYTHPEGPVDLIENWGFEFERDSFKSFLASWWQDWIFFILIGAPAAWLFSINPANEHFHARLGWLFAGRHKTVAVEDHLTNLVRENSAFNKEAHAEIYISAYDPDLDAFKITITINTVFCNLLKNEQYDEIISVDLTTDGIAPSDGLCGEITQFEICRPKPSDTRTAPEPLSEKLPVKSHTEDNNHCSANGRIMVDADESVYYTCSFWHWSKISVPLSFDLLRFTENVTISVRHDCGGEQSGLEIPFSLDHPTSNGFWTKEGFKRKILRYNKPIVVGTYKQVQAGERFRFVFSSPQRIARLPRLAIQRRKPSFQHTTTRIPQREFNA